MLLTLNAYLIYVTKTYFPHEKLLESNHLPKHLKVSFRYLEAVTSINHDAFNVKSMRDVLLRWKMKRYYLTSLIKLLCESKYVASLVFDYFKTYFSIKKVLKYEWRFLWKCPWKNDLLFFNSAKQCFHRKYKHNKAATFHSLLINFVNYLFIFFSFF